MTRIAISKMDRFEIFKRDSFTCQYCGATPPRVILHVDHINPVALGGDNSPDNLITACSACNLGKSARPLSSAPKTLADRAVEIEEREAQISGFAAIMEAARERVEDDCWRVAEQFDRKAKKGFDRRKFASIKRFVEELGVHDALDAADIALTAKPYNNSVTFKYFCGVCWRKIRERADG